MRPLTLVMLAAAVACHPPGGHAVATPDTTDATAAGAADREMSSMAGMSTDPHMAMTPTWPLAAGDSARARALVDQVRASFAKYKDVRVAEADGFKEFLPNVKNQKVYHFTSTRNAITARFSFDPLAPTSLLYKEEACGRVD